MIALAMSAMIGLRNVETQVGTLREVMIKSLKGGIEKISARPVHKSLAAELSHQLPQSDAAPYVLSPDEQTAVREALDRAEQGRMADEADVDEALRRPWG
jgi:hypothetical protein